jgi:hypothetical protein
MNAFKALIDQAQIVAEDAYEIERKKQLEIYLKKRCKRNMMDLIEGGHDAENVKIELNKL